MLKNCILLLLFALCVTSKRRKEIFELDADDIVASEIGDLYEERARLNKIKDSTILGPLNTQIANETTQGNLTENINMTTPSPEFQNGKMRLLAMASIPPDIVNQYRNLTMRELKIRRMEMQIDKILNTDHKTVSEYLTNGDDPNTCTGQFDKMVEEYNRTNIKTRRELYDYGDNQPMKWAAKTNVMNLMNHFVYVTRYKLVFTQVLRNKYVNNLRYRLGFLFALLRHLKNMQKWLWWVLSFRNKSISTIFFHLKLFEKLMRFDTDIRDVILLIERTEYARNMQYNPKFYDYSMEKNLFEF